MHQCILPQDPRQRPSLTHSRLSSDAQALLAACSEQDTVFPDETSNAVLQAAQGQSGLLMKVCLDLGSALEHASRDLQV